MLNWGEMEMTTFTYSVGNKDCKVEGQGGLQLWKVGGQGGPLKRWGPRSKVGGQALPQQNLRILQLLTTKISVDNMYERWRRERNFCYVCGKTSFWCHLWPKMGATVASMSKEMGANPRRWGPLTPWPPLIYITAFRNGRWTSFCESTKKWTDFASFNWKNGLSKMHCCIVTIGPTLITTSVNQ